MAGKVTNKTMSDLLLRIYELPEADDFFEHVLSVLDTFVNSEFSAYSFTNVEARTFRPQAMHRLGAGGRKLPGLKEMAARSQAHPFRDIYYERGKGPVLCTTDVMSEAEWTQTELYNEVWRPAGLLHDTSIRFYEGSNCYSFFFSSPVPLSEDFRRALELIAPHLGQAYHAFKAQQQGVSGGFPDHMVLLSADGHPEECSAMAEGLLARYYPGSKKTAGWQFPEEVERWLRAGIRCFSSTEGETVDHKLMVRRGRGVLCLKLMRIRGRYALLLEETIAVREFDVLLKMGMTQREAEVLLWVFQGKRNSEIALILQISTATVRKHIEHILQKLHCETRGAVTQMAMHKVVEQLQGAELEKCSTCSKPVCDNCISISS